MSPYYASLNKCIFCVPFALSCVASGSPEPPVFIGISEVFIPFFNGSGGRTRTYNHTINSRVLYH